MWSVADVAELLDALHRPKDAAYGDAWCRRGELLGIFCNIARKADRLDRALNERTPAAVESTADTVADLAVYAGKYLTWLADEYPVEFERVAPAPPSDACRASRGPDALTRVLAAVVELERRSAQPDLAQANQELVAAFAALETGLTAQAERSPIGQLAPVEKIALAWRLTAAACELLVALAAERPETIAALREQVARLGG